MVTGVSPSGPRAIKPYTSGWRASSELVGLVGRGLAGWLAGARGGCVDTGSCKLVKYLTRSRVSIIPPYFKQRGYVRGWLRLLDRQLREHLLLSV